MSQHYEGDGPPYVKIAHPRLRYPISELSLWAVSLVHTATSASPQASLGSESR
jgi:hypothetical protein